MSTATIQRGLWRFTPAAPFAGGIVVYLVYRFFFIAAKIYDIKLGFSPKDLSIEEGHALTELQSIVARLTWSVTGIFFVLALIVSVTVLLWIINAALRDRSPAVRGTVIGAALVSGLACVWFSMRDDLFTVADFNLILERSFTLLEIRSAPELAPLYTGFMLLVAVLLMFAASASLTRPSNGASNSSAGRLRRQTRRLNTALFVGATMIVAGIVHAIALHRLPGALLDEARADELNSVIHALSTGIGAVWTFILLGIYLPAALILRWRALELAHSELPDDAPPDTVSEWLSEHGLTSHAVQQLARIAALLGPLLVGGPAAPFLQLLTG